MVGSKTHSNGRSREGDVRRQILAEATRLFADRGLEATSLQEIADAVGVKKPSVLYHFPSKEAIYRGVVEDLTSRWNDTLPRLLKAAASQEDRLLAILDEVATFFAEDSARARILVREALDRPQLLRELLRNQGRSWIALLAAAIRTAQEEGRMDVGLDAEAYILDVIILLIGTFAFGPILQSLLAGPAPKEVHARLLKELRRVVSVSGMARPKKATGAKAQAK